MNTSNQHVDDPDRKPGRKLIVFADGTGNAFTQQESNIWRLYQMLDRTSPDQKALYIQGVGTSGNAILASLDSATGFGVPSNVRKLYQFLCWNWQEGDEIYMFGFSRGAFTIRCLAGLIASQGLMPQNVDGRPSSTADLEANAMGAWRAYRAETAPFKWSNFLEDIKTTSPSVAITRHVRDLLIMLWRWAQRRQQHSKVRDFIRRNQPERTPENMEITFLGLFDTVEAYGLPIEEFRGVVNWAIWPISFRNRLSSPIVKSIRHALSLDDERTTFHPIRFDQSNDPISEANTPPRTREVWFSGVHSDVGGGYADDSLALIPFSWMVDEARRAGLRFDEDAISQLTNRSSPIAPIHNSRKGLASFYRYDPRRVTDARADGGPPIIHHSVAEKIVFGTGGYAPIVLPKKVKALAPDGRLEDIAGLGSPHIRTAVHHSESTAEEAIQALQANPPNPALLDQVRKLVLWRRISYFLLLTMTVIIALMPVLGSSFEALIDFLLDKKPTGYFDAAIDGFVAFGGEWAGAFLPGFVTPWIDALRNYSISMVVCLLLWFAFYRSNASLHDHIRDSAYEAWVARQGPPSQLPYMLRQLISLGEKLTLGPIWGRVHRISTRFLAPALFTLALVLGVGIALSRSTMGVLTRSGYICQQSVPGEDASNGASRKEGDPLLPGGLVRLKGFSPKQLCWSTTVDLVKGQTYTFWIDPEKPFVDRTIVTPPRGFLSNSWVHFLTQKTLRRSREAAWLQPIAQIGIRADAVFPLASADGLRLSYETGFEPAGPLGWSESWEELNDTDRRLFEAYREKEAARQRTDSTDKFVTRFIAPADGTLYLYVNDVVPALPFLGYLTWFYDNNEGTAQVTIIRDPLPVAAQKQNI